MLKILYVTYLQRDYLASTLITTLHFLFLPDCRTKWKRQTAVGMELLAEAGNYAAFQRLYGTPPFGCWPYSGAGSNPPSAADLYYRQAAAAAAAVSTLQKPLAYRLYPGLPGPGPSPTPPHIPASPALAASASLSSLSNYYNSVHGIPVRSPSLNADHPPRSHSPDSRPESVDVEDDSPGSPNVDV